MIHGTYACIDAFRFLFGAVLDGEEIDVTLRFDNTRSVLYLEETCRFTDEKYRLSVTEDGSRFAVDVCCSGEKSGFYSLCGLAERYRSRQLTPGVSEDAPAFSVRGYIEGFYGKPWTQPERLELLRFAAKHRMNAVYYAPKDDPYHRKLWREPYPPELLSGLRSLIGEAGRFYMDFTYCIAPGLSIRYADADEMTALMQKTKQLYALGVRSFGLLLDDIDGDLRFPEDRARYGELVNAHIDLIQRYDAALCELDPALRLTVCPTVYHGGGNEYYVSKLGRSVSPRVSVFWTGRDICSRELTEYEALRFFEATFHKPLYWDNYPVNDMAMHHEMHLGPLINRSPLLGRCAEGIIANCMEYAQCTKIPLATIAAYLWEGERYAPETAWEQAIEEVVGTDAAPAFAVFADLLRTSCLLDDNAKGLTDCLQRVSAAFASGDPASAKETAAAYLQKMRECESFLRRELPVCRELRVWAEKFSLLIPVVETAFAYFEEKKESQAASIRAMLTEYNALPAKLAEDMVVLEFLD